MRRCAAAALALLWAGAASAEPRVVALVPLGPVDARLLEVARQAVEKRLEATVRIEASRPLPRSAWYAPRRRWRAEKILEALQADPPAGAFKVVAMTSAEISTTNGTVEDWRVAGLGTVGGVACVASTWINERHSRTREDLDRRTADLVVHELGHTLGLDHCDAPGCVMHDAKGRYLETADTSSGEYCPRCRGRLPAGLLRR